MKFIYLISTIIFIVSCSQKKELVISDISKSQSFIIESSNNNPSVLKIKFKGEINDTCIIHGIKIAPSDLGKDYFFDSYSKKIIVKYYQYKVKKGNLIINYSYY